MKRHNLYLIKKIIYNIYKIKVKIIIKIRKYNYKNKKYPDELDIDFIVYNREERLDIINQLYFADFSSYQCMTSQYTEGKHIINSYTISTLKDSISLQSKIIKKKDSRETKRTIDKKSTKKFKIITQIHSKLEKRRKYIKKQKI